jgi:NitT/TauT family transport system substrate-binding protein
MRTRTDTLQLSHAFACLLLLITVGCAATPPAVEPEPAPQAAEPTPQAAEPIELNVGIAIPSWAHAVAWVTEDAGIFEAHGIDASVIQMKGSASSMRGLLSGDIDVALAGGDAMIKANLAGADLVLVGGLVNRHYHRLVTVPTVQKPEDLKGKSFGLPFLGGPQDMAVKMALDKFGLSYNEDVKVKNMGSEYARLASLSRGDVDAVTSSAPKSVVDALGMNVLVDLSEWDMAFPYMQVIAQRSFIEEDEARALALLRALGEGTRYYKDKPAESIAIVTKYLGDKSGSAQESYDTRGPGHLSYPPFPDPAGLETVMAFLAEENPKAAEHKASEYVTTRYLDTLKAEGAFGSAP